MERDTEDFPPLVKRTEKTYKVCDYCKKVETKTRDNFGDPICSDCIRAILNGETRGGC